MNSLKKEAAIMIWINPLIRYADILLTYAEATNETDGPTALVFKAINKVRRRARIVETAFEQNSKVYPDLAGLTKDGFKDALLKDRTKSRILILTA